MALLCRVREFFLASDPGQKSLEPLCDRSERRPREFWASHRSLLFEDRNGLDSTGDWLHPCRGYGAQTGTARHDREHARAAAIVCSQHSPQKRKRTGIAPVLLFSRILNASRHRSARDRFAGWRRQHSGHLANHRQHQPLVAIRQGAAVAFDLHQKPDFVLRKLAEHLLRFAVPRRFRAREKVGEGNVHRLGNFRKRFKRRNCVAVFHARKVASQQPRATFNVSLRQTALAAVSLDHIPDVDSWFFFWHERSPHYAVSLVTNSRSSKKDF